MLDKTKTKWYSVIPEIKELGLQGMNMSQLAIKYGITKQRMKQIIDSNIPDWQENYGFAVGRKASQRTYEAKWGTKEDSDLYQTKRAKFRAKKSNSTRTGWEWDVAFGDLQWPTHCPILGLEIDYFTETRAENSLSFDRIDSNKGYVKDNVQLLSWRANRIKNDGTAEEHLKIAEYLKKTEIVK